MRSRTIPLSIGSAFLLIILWSVTATGTVNPSKARPLDRQILGVISGPLVVRATSFRTLQGWGPSDSPNIEGRSGMAATLSVTIEGGPVEFRMFLEDVDRGFATRMLGPAARFDPGSGTASSSYTWVAWLRPGPYTVNIEWRSIDGVPVTLDAGTLVVQFGALKTSTS